MHQHYLLVELHGAYREILDDIKSLENDFLPIAKMQQKLLEDDSEPFSNAVANMLFNMQDVTEDKLLSRAEIRECLFGLSTIRGVRSALISIVSNYYSATALMIEHLYFANRLMQRQMDLPREKRLLPYWTLSKEDCVYPQERLDAMREKVYTIWRTNATETPR